MLDFLQQVLLLLILLLTSEVKTQSCSPGYFGEGCKFKCKCASEAACSFNGTCPGACGPNQYGPSCQFVAKLYDYATANWIKDKDHSTCNPDPSATSVVATFTDHTFVEIRIYTRNNQANRGNFTTKLNNNIPCVNEQHFPDKNYVDVTCDNNIFLNKYTIEGPIAPDICTIYVNIGRQLGLKENATQSTTSTSDGIYGSADKAVDGSRDVDFTHGSCTHTTHFQTNWWALKLSMPVQLSYIDILNRNSNRQRLNGLSVEAYSINGSRHFSWTDTTTDILGYYDVMVDSKIPTTVVKIIGRQTYTDPLDRILTLCEVELYGEMVCPDGTWGLWCQETCACDKDSSCHPVTGACGNGCATGTYGFGCQAECSSVCLEKRCGARYGHCIACYPGYIGIDCEKTCDAGSYGSGCKDKCSEHCANVCDRAAGNCSCSGNYKEPDCRVCADGYFGLECNDNCSEHCADVCDKVMGNCLCKENYGGSHCTECEDGFYGPDCTDTCSEHCGTLCDHDTGNCTCLGNFGGSRCKECIDGFFGAECNDTCSKYCTNMCDHVHGNCTCQENYGGPLCTGCDNKHFGPKCESRCPASCADGACDQATGNCSECTDNYSGPLCDIQLSEVKAANIMDGTNYTPYIMGALATLATIFGLFFFCAKRDKGDQGDGEKESQH